MFAQQRKVQFEEGEPFHFHSLASAEEAVDLVTSAEKEVEDIRTEVSERQANVKYPLKIRYICMYIVIR